MEQKGIDPKVKQIMKMVNFQIKNQNLQIFTKVKFNLEKIVTDENILRNQYERDTIILIHMKDQKVDIKFYNNIVQGKQ